MVVHMLTSAVQWLSLLICTLIMTPIVMLLMYDVTLYAMRVAHTKDVVKSSLEWCRGWRSWRSWDWQRLRLSKGHVYRTE